MENIINAVKRILDTKIEIVKLLNPLFIFILNIIYFYIYFIL